MKAMKLQAIIIAMSPLLAGLASCDRRELEYHYTAGAQVYIKVDWTRYVEKPSGMTVLVLGENGFKARTTTSNVDSVSFTLAPGAYDVYAFNQSEEEFGTIAFSGMDEFGTPEAIVEKVASRWFVSKTKTNAGEEKMVSVNPEDLGVGIGHFEVTDDMLEAYRGYYKRGQGKPSWADRPDYLKVPITTLYPTDVTAELQVTAYIKQGFDYMLSVRGAISGMAERFMMTKSVTGSQDVTQVLESWNKVRESDGSGYVRIRTNISTFGLPAFDEQVEDPAKRDSTSNIFTISFLLRDGKTQKDFDFYVGHRFVVEKDPVSGKRAKFILDVGNKEDIILPYVDPQPGNQGGGFTADVIDWDEVINADIPI